LVACKLAEEYGLPFNFRDVVMTPGAMAALNIVFRTLFLPEDEIVVLSPCWLDYPLYLANLGIRPCFVPLNENKRFDLPKMAQAIGERTKGILLSQPCCPTGVLYSKEEVEALAKILANAEVQFRHPIYLISDEVHRHLAWSQDTFYSPLQSYPRSVSIYSFGKALFLQGQRIGYVTISPRMPERLTIRQQLERCVQMMGFCAPTNLMQRAVCKLLDYRPQLDLIADQQTIVRRQLEVYGYEVCSGGATFFVYVRSPIRDDFRFVECLARAGVLVLPSTLFHEVGYFRISLTARPDSVKAGLPAFERVLEQLKSPSYARIHPQD
jgi:aspartate aminotransferase